MSLISGVFLAFTALVVLVYYLLPMRLRSPWLLAASLAFYLYADLRYMAFLLFTIALSYAAGRLLPRARRPRLLLALALLMVLGMMAVLKFLPYSLALARELFGLELGSWSWIYPLGISFFSLQAASYVIDVYRGDILPEKSFWRYCLFMSFFPIITQGPISRYQQLAPQLGEGHELNYRQLCFGAQLALWGFFKKLVVADRAGLFVDTVYAQPEGFGSFAVILAALLYTLQLYADFSGCVDICRGIAQMLGIDLMENFRRPFFAASIQELWRRWHISLSSWFRDYVYIPLGGSRKGSLRRMLNTMAVFALSGLWHGAGANFLFWGLLQGAYIVLGGLSRGLRQRFWQRLSIRLPRAFSCLGCFLLFAFSMHFFRAPGLSSGLIMARSAITELSLSHLSDGSLLALGLDLADFGVLFLGLLLMLLVSLWQEKHSEELLRERVAALALPLRWGIYLGGLMAVLILGIYGPGYSSAQFIYMGF